MGSGVTDASKLNVKGSAGFADDGTNAGIIISTDDANGAALSCLTTGGFVNGSYGNMRLNALSHKFTYGNTVRMLIKSDGKVGINESSPDRDLHISNATNGGVLRFTNTDTTIADDTICGMIEFEQRDSNTPGVSANVRAELTLSLIHI